MKIKELQKAIAAELNALDELVQGGGKAFAKIQDKGAAFSAHGGGDL